MKVLIVENEIYLAQSISIKLSDMGFNCEIVSSANDVNANKHYDVILLSAGVHNFSQVIEMHKQSVIILLISYVSADTVSIPLKAGASDYIQKPFMIEELVRKIKHYQHYKKLEIINKAYSGYIESKLKTIKIAEFDYKKIKLPLILQANIQVNADTFVFNYIKERDLILSYIDLSNNNSLDKIFKSFSEYSLFYLTNFQTLKGNERDRVLEFMQKKSVILHTTTEVEGVNFNTINLNDTEKTLHNSEILTIDEYVKYIIHTYQSVFPDTDLSKKLGISRKSLWEKRKKYGIAKKK